jgi:hypothetical protein
MKLTLILALTHVRPETALADSDLSPTWLETALADSHILAMPVVSCMFCLRALSRYHSVPGCIYMFQHMITLWLSSVRFAVRYVTN